MRRPTGRPRPPACSLLTKGYAVNKKMALATAACVVAATLTLSGCNSEVEEPNVPADGSSAAVSSSYNYTLTDAEKLKALAIGETAVWRDYEVTVTSVERADGKLTAHVTVRSHTLPQALGADCLLSFGMPPVDSSFEDGIIAVPAGEEASGTLTFDDRYGSERLFWNDGATEGTWDLTLPAVQPDQEGGNEGIQPAETDEPKTDEPKKQEPKNDAAAEAQKQAVAALEAEMPSLFTNNTFYTFQSVDTSTATVTPQEGGGYEYVNDVSILGADGVTPTTANVRLICEPNGNCISMTVDGAFLF